MTSRQIHVISQDRVTGRFLKLEVASGSGSRAEDVGVQLLQVIGKLAFLLLDISAVGGVNEDAGCGEKCGGGEADFSPKRGVVLEPELILDLAHARGV